jgi:DNA-binding GntR family transcriptional regulator
MSRQPPPLQAVRPAPRASKVRASARWRTRSGQHAAHRRRHHHAIVERRLMPGTKLAEQQIADIFKVSRTLVRQALNQLSRDHLVTLEPARGAFVAQPSVEEARQVFEVRKMLEAGHGAPAVRRVTPTRRWPAARPPAAEADAVARTDVAGRTRLLADFHVVLARLLGNEVLAQLLADLLSRCSLIALMYQSLALGRTFADEHVAIVDASSAATRAPPCG